MKYIKLDISFLLNDYGFKIIDESSVDRFGGDEIITLYADNVYINIIKDRDLYSFEFSSDSIKKDKEWNEYMWFDWDIVKTYLDKKTTYINSEDKVPDEIFFDTEFRLQYAELPNPKPFCTELSRNWNTVYLPQLAGIWKKKFPDTCTEVMIISTDLQLFENIQFSF